ncbi:unnamed protein product [Moneuplotes crassus]|uniref:Uncharacterized protein n=1 Tax=Euplotes crassus TaxID=5936 RepID=A0AAD2D751_EUPCR|nr:unnamed protein product [Moneuplotes crassus]
MEGDDLEYMSAQMKELDKQIFKLKDSNNYLIIEGEESGLTKDEIEEICKENEGAIETKLEEIKKYAKRFKPDDERLPLIIPYAFNMLPETMRAGRVIDPNKVIEEIERREQIARDLAAQLQRRAQIAEYELQQQQNDEEEKSGHEESNLPPLSE